MLDETAVHILGGGIGGTVGAIITCPLEVIKVRLQSSRGSELRDTVIPLATEHYPSTSSGNSTLPNATRFGRRLATWSPSLCQSQHDGTASPKCSSVPSSFSHITPYRTQRAACQLSITTFTDSSSPATEAAAAATGRKHTGWARSLLLRGIVDISRNEGISALFKGLIPTLLGVLPSRGIYFCAYHKGQVLFQEHLPSGSSAVYLCAAGFGSITASSLTNPIWFIKTRLQLDSRPGLPPITVGQVIQNTWRHEGIRGFYRGVSASYVGSLETALNFMIYENVKARLLWWQRTRQQALLEKRLSPPNSSSQTTPQSTASASVICSYNPNTNEKDLRGSRGGSKLNASSDMVLCMVASAFSKAIAITALYPHEVVRTRLREVKANYRGFLSTLLRVAREEGATGLYRGMGTHYIRQVPNSCIMIGTYEVVVFLLQSWGLTRIT